MNFKKYIRTAVFFCATLVLAVGTVPAPVGAEAYTYTSERYGYCMDCPQKPVGVIPASMLYADKKGDVLIFANDGYQIQKAWLVLVDGFNDKDIPNLNKISDADAKKLAQNLLEHNGYAEVKIVPVNAENKGLYAVTAKQVEVDTNGDGKPDTVATADNQMAVTFFRGNRGGRFSVQLIDNPTLTQANIDEYRAGMSTFQEIAPVKAEKKHKK